MSANITNQVAFLRTSREYPEDLHQLSQEVSKSYIDIANAVNGRTIGLFPASRSAINGESWFLTTQRQQGLRQVYTFTSTGNIPHGLNFSSIERFTRGFGSFTDGTNYYGVIYGSNTAIPNQISFYITPTNIVVLSGAGAPTITNGVLVIEWISHV
jgi:hypothetical protein